MDVSKMLEGKTAISQRDSLAEIPALFTRISSLPNASLTDCILIGWVVKPKVIIEEAEKTGSKFGRKGLYIVMIRYVAPVYYPQGIHPRRLPMQ